MSKIFCGIGNVPKGKKLGNMKECVELGQTRYYGLKKIDKRLIDNYLEGKKKKSSKNVKLQDQINKLKLEYVSYCGKKKRLEGKFKAEKNKDEKEKITKDIDSINKKLNKLKDDMKKLENKKGSTQSRQLPRKKLSRKKPSKKNIYKKKTH